MARLRDTGHGQHHRHHDHPRRRSRPAPERLPSRPAHRGTRGAHLTVLCHSYGSVVCGRAAPDSPRTTSP
ncbi:alpha/beta hydrolase [Streptomyces nogalater]